MLKLLAGVASFGLKLASSGLARVASRLDPPPADEDDSGPVPVQNPITDETREFLVAHTPEPKRTEQPVERPLEGSLRERVLAARGEP